MTVPDLISVVLDSIRNQFYPDRAREFLRDERALMRAISRYGYECDQRGWGFDVPHILKALLDLLQDIKKREADIQYLPVYLDSAVRRHIGQRAEELSEKAKRTTGHVNRIVKNARRVEVIREPTATEILSAVYLDLKRNRRRKAVAMVKQGGLL